MKNQKYYILILVLFLLTQILLAQEKPKAPLEPKKPVDIDQEFDFEFQKFFEMKEEDEKKLLKNLNETLRKNLEQIKKVNKEKYIDLLRESQFKNIKIPFIVKHEKLMQERENKIFEAEVEVEALAAKHKNTTEKEQRKIKQELKKELNNLFDLKEERRKQEVEELQKELSELKKSLEVRLRNKDKIIERRMQELLEEDQYLEWD
jgi:hypothetical protein